MKDLPMPSLPYSPSFAPWVDRYSKKQAILIVAGFNLALWGVIVLAMVKL